MMDKQRLLFNISNLNGILKAPNLFPDESWGPIARIFRFKQVVGRQMNEFSLPPQTRSRTPTHTGGPQRREKSICVSTRVSVYTKDTHIQPFTFIHIIQNFFFLFCRRSSTSDNLDQLSSNDSLSSTVVKNLELADHLTSVLRGVVHGIATGGNFTGITLGQSL